eukprot:COSAG02_NODE_26_length_51927_cov_61.213881_12_plen_71_part_00
MREKIGRTVLRKEHEEKIKGLLEAPAVCGGFCAQMIRSQKGVTGAETIVKIKLMNYAVWGGWVAQTSRLD